MTANWEASPDRTPKDESAAALGSIQDEETGDLSCADGAVIRPLSPTKNNMSLQEEALDPICLVGNGVIFLNKDPLTASKIAIIAFLVQFKAEIWSSSVLGGSHFNQVYERQALVIWVLQNYIILNPYEDYG